MTFRIAHRLRQMVSATSLAGLAAGLAMGAASPAIASGSQAPMDAAVVRARADALIAQMTPEEKAAQLSLYFYFPALGSMNKPAEDAIEAGMAGSVLFVTDPVEVNHLQRIAVEKSRLHIPMLFGFDVIHGLRTIFPVPLGLAASWDPALVEKVQGSAAAEARAVGVNWAYAPMLDIARDPRWGRIVEGSGEDPYLGSAMAVAQVRGFQGSYLGQPGHVLATAKHFVGYGAALGGRDYDEVNLSDNELWNVYLPPFKAAVDAGVGSVMSAYMSLNGVPAAANHWLLSDVLRGDWGFKGLVVSDASAVNALRTQNLTADKSESAIRGLTAGVDMEMVSPVDWPAYATLPAALRAGQIPPERLDAAVRAVLEAKIRLGLFEKPYVDADKAESVLSDPAHLDLARVAAERSAVLLRNTNSLLPLDRASIKSIAVIGPLADSERDLLGSWTFPQNKPTAVTVLAGLRAKLGKATRVDYVEGVRMPPRTFASSAAMLEKPDTRPPLDENAGIARAVEAAKASDAAVLVLGETFDMTGEGASRSSLDLPGRQQELLDAVVATGKPVVVVLMSARPLNLKDTKARAILDVWYPGSAGGTAVANLLFGDAAPAGKLPFTWIREAAQAPNPYAHLISQEPGGADRRYWNGSSAPTYPFGYGLGYTSFSFTNLRVDRPTYANAGTVRISVDLTNTGARAGEDVAQLYIHQRSGSAARPVRELKGFQRVLLKPGETRTLTFELKPEDRRYWSAATHGWVNEPAAFDAWVGDSSQASLGTKFTITQN